MIKRIVLLAILIAVTAVAAAGLWAWRLARAAPEWYAPPAIDDTESINIANDIEYEVQQQLHFYEEDEAWELEVSQKEANAWLATRLPEWVQHEGGGQWPQGLGQPQIQLQDDAIDIAFALSADSPGEIVVARVRPQVSNGELRLSLAHVGVGQLTLPGSPTERLLELLEGSLPDGRGASSAVHDIVSLLSGQRGIDARVDLSDGREVLVTDFQIRQGKLLLQNRTERPGNR